MLNFTPSSILLEIGPLRIHWYGLIIVFAVLVAVFIVDKLARKKDYNIKKLDSLYFYVIVFGLIGARVYEVLFFNWHYYKFHLLDIFKIWQGGLAIQGVILFGIIAIYVYCKKNKLNFLKYTDIFTIGLILGQAIGRWGNFFNQELFGRISDLPWAIYIERTMNFHHPVFLYESLLNFALFFILLKLFKRRHFNGMVTFVYLGGYSLIRFFMEFIRIDKVPIVFGVRLPQLISFLVIIAVVILIFWFDKKRNI